MKDKEKVAWILLWDQVQKWYGDITKAETAAQFTERMSSKFSVTVKFPSDTDEEYSKLINSDQI